MATQAQIDANRQNAQHSTGPVTEAGRAAVSQNRTTHGLTGEFKTRTEAETAEYARLLEKLCEDHNANTTTEIELVSKMVQSLMRSNRAGQLQDLSLDLIGDYADIDEEACDRARKDLELYTRYQASADRAYQRYAAELRKFQEANRKVEIGFESQKRQRAEETRKQERHDVIIATAKARLEHQLFRNSKLSAPVPVENAHQNAAPACEVPLREAA